MTTNWCNICYWLVCEGIGLYVSLSISRFGSLSLSPSRCSVLAARCFFLCVAFLYSLLTLCSLTRFHSVPFSLAPPQQQRRWRQRRRRQVVWCVRLSVRLLQCSVEPKNMRSVRVFVCMFLCGNNEPENERGRQTDT